MKDEEILELGADGTFSIPSPSKKATIKEAKPLQQPTKTVPPPSKPVAVTTPKAPETVKAPEPPPKKETVKVPEPQKTKTNDVHDLLNSVSPGEYKVYRDGSTINVIVCLQDEQKVTSMSMTDNQIRLLISDTIPKELVVPLPMSVNPQTASCRTFKSFVTLQVTVSSSQ